MKTTDNNSMPMVVCPHCEKEFQWDDYYELAVGDSRECPKCEKEIHVTYVDHCIFATLGTESPKE